MNCESGPRRKKGLLVIGVPFVWVLFGRRVSVGKRDIPQKQKLVVQKEFKRELIKGLFGMIMGPGWRLRFLP
jgi:hypothetical protein